jgi:hypothetical protein
MLIRRGRGKGTLLLGRLDPGDRWNPGDPLNPIADTVPGDGARGLPRKRSLAEDRPGLKVAIALRDGLRTLPRTRFRRPSTAGVSDHG